MTAKENRTLIINYLKSLGIEPYKLWFERRRLFQSSGTYMVEVLKNGFLEDLNMIFLIYETEIIVFDWGKGETIYTIKKGDIK